MTQSQDSNKPDLDFVQENEDENLVELSKSVDGESEDCVQQAEQTETTREILEIPISQSLLKKIKEKAGTEGVSVQDFARELIAEGLVLRAWEIIERKSNMRQNNPQKPYNQNRQQTGRSNYRQNNNFSRNRQLGQGNSNQQNHRRNNYNNILEDNANFIEYVRNQEKNRR